MMLGQWTPTHVITSWLLTWQELLSSCLPDLLPSSVLDLSSGGQLPLHLAAAAGNVGVMRLLIDAGAQLEAVNGLRETALQA
jgi:hypothetical protein